MTGTGFLAQITNVLPHLRNRFALIGLVVAVAGFVATQVVAPEYIHAQIAAGTIGVLFLVFGQVFHHLGSFPEAERTRLITRLFLVFVTLVLALIGLTGYFLQNTFRTAVNAKYLATLVGKEPFAEALPRPLVQSGFDYVQINEASAAARLSAVHVKLAPDPALAKGFGDDIQIFAHIEVYPTDQAARKRSSASMAFMVARYQVGLEAMSPESFCVDGGAFWSCAGYRGLAYAEVTLSPGINAYHGVATGALSALLGYTNKLAALATN